MVGGGDWGVREQSKGRGGRPSSINDVGHSFEFARGW